MRKHIKRYLAVGLSVMMMLSGCSGIGNKGTDEQIKTSIQQGATGQTEQVLPYQSVIASTYRHGSTYEEDYIKQHLDYIAGEEYETIRENMKIDAEGGLAGAMGKAYEEAGLDDVNQTWELFSVTSKTLAGKSVKLKTGYEPVVSALMQTTASQQAFIDSYNTACFDAVIAFFKGLGECASSGSKVLSEYEKPGSNAAKLLAGDINDALLELQKLEKMDLLDEAKKSGADEKTLKAISQTELTGLYEDKLKELKDKLVKYYPDFKEPETLKKVMKKLGVEKTASEFAKSVFKDTKEGAEIIAESYEELIDLYIVRMALAQATDEWFYSWELISGSAMAAGNDEAKKLMETIDEILVDLRSSQESAEMAYLEALKEESGNIIFRIGQKELIGYYDEITNKYPMVALAKMSANFAHELADGLTNMDETAFYGRMLHKTGILAVYVEDAMDTAERLLKSEQSFQTAVLFDELFHCFKEVQLQACDYAIEYYGAMAASGVNKVMKHNAGEALTTTFQLTAEKAIWREYFCHKHDLESYEGYYLLMDGKLYFWDMEKESYEAVNVGGFRTVGFDLNAAEENVLVEMDLETREKKKIAKTAGGSGKLWYAGERFFGSRAPAEGYAGAEELISFRADGSGLESYGIGTWEGFDRGTASMIGFTKNGVQSVSVNDGTVKLLAEAKTKEESETGIIPGVLDVKDEAIRVTEGYLFYRDKTKEIDDSFVVRVRELESGKDMEIFRMDNMIQTYFSQFGGNAGMGVEIGATQETDSYLYVSFGGVGGSSAGILFQGGKILRMAKRGLFDGGTPSDLAVLAEPEADRMHLKEKDFFVAREKTDGSEAEKDRLYFTYLGEYMNTSHTWLEGARVDPVPFQIWGASGEISASWGNGLKYGMYGTTPESYQDILIADEMNQMAADAGYPGNDVEVENLEVVDGVLYGILWISHYEPGNTWDTFLDEAVMFEKDLKSGEICFLE